MSASAKAHKSDVFEAPTAGAPAPSAVETLDGEVEEALAICGGDPLAALRITLIANAFLEAEIERLSAAVSSGYARGNMKKPKT
jgi:hypothetical protein